MIKENNTALLELINDTLEMSRIESNTINWSYEDVNPLAIMHDVYEYASPRISENVRLILDDSPNVSLHTDKHKLMLILKKLLSNALRYTDTNRCIRSACNFTCPIQATASRRTN